MHATRQAKAKWMIIGQEGGSMIRCQMSRLTSPAINAVRDSREVCFVRNCDLIFIFT